MIKLVLSYPLHIVRQKRIRNTTQQQPIPIIPDRGAREIPK